MKMRLRSRQFGWMFRLLSLLFAGALFIVSITPSWVLAQSSEDPWTKPLNLSRTGFAANAGFVIDSEGMGHVIWQDDLEDYMYTRFEGNQWSTPVITDLQGLFELPITGVLSGPAQLEIYRGPNPFLIAGHDQAVFALWLGSEGGLFQSKVEGQSFDRAAAWDSARMLTPEAASFGATVDADGELHVVFLRMIGDLPNPAGIYYVRSKGKVSSWAKPVLLYESPYLRTLAEGEANLSIATIGTGEALNVLIAWDNQPRKQVLLAQSADAGQTWGEPALIAGPAPDSGLAGPFNIRVGANQDSVVLVWQHGQPGGTCNQIYQSSDDAGATWSEPQLMIDNLLGCAEANAFVRGSSTSNDAPMYFLTETKSQTFLSAWNGLQWSEPQAQPILSGFEEPEIYTEVIYRCHRAALLEERMFVVGCDEGPGGDVWVTSRDLGSNTSALKSPAWSPLSPVNNDNYDLQAIELVTTDDGLFHAFFSQHQDSQIYYTNWDGELWSRTTSVLELPDGEAGLPAIAAGPADELLLFVPNNRGELFFSRAISSGAAIASSWSIPTRLELNHNGKLSAVDVALDSAGTLYLTYSVPVNVERGIYLVQSKDQGATWSEPLQVFDGSAAGFDFIGVPSLLNSENGSLHVIWKVQSISGDGLPQPLSLYYARSLDGGHTFSNPEVLVDEPVDWGEIATDGEGNLHLLWQLPDTLTTVWDQVSSDDGNTWQYPNGLPHAGGFPTVTRDPAGKLHLVGVGSDTLDHRLWDGSRWQSETSPGWFLSSEQDGTGEVLTAAINKQGKMMVVLARPTAEGDVEQDTLLYSIRTLELQSSQNPTQQSPTQTTLPPTVVPETTTAESLSTPTIAIASETPAPEGPKNQDQAGGPLSPLAIALVPVGLLLLGVLGLVIWRAARAKDR